MIPPSVLPDLLATVLGLEWEARVDLLGLPDPEDRAKKVKEAMMGILVSRGIDPPEEPTPKPTALSTPVSTALNRGPARKPPSRPKEVPEDLQPLHALLSRRVTELTTSARGAIDRELARLAKIPPQSAEYSVAKTYVEWLLALPWKRTSEPGKEVDLEEAKRRLEAEHEGLEAVKRRVVEYLAVYR
jgi:ATP-dependent Lon protease